MVSISKRPVELKLNADDVVVRAESIVLRAKLSDLELEQIKDQDGEIRFVLQVRLSAKFIGARRR